MVSRNAIIEPEVVEELRRSRLTSHNCSTLRKSIRRLNQDSLMPATLNLYDSIGPKRSLPVLLEALNLSDEFETLMESKWNLQMQVAYIMWR